MSSSPREADSGAPRRRPGGSRSGWSGRSSTSARARRAATRRSMMTTAKTTLARGSLLFGLLLGLGLLGVSTAIPKQAGLEPVSRREAGLTIAPPPRPARGGGAGGGGGGGAGPPPPPGHTRRDALRQQPEAPRPRSLHRDAGHRPSGEGRVRAAHGPRDRCGPLVEPRAGGVDAQAPHADREPLT